MADTKFGVFIPNELDNSVEVLKSSIAGRPLGEPTPTETDVNFSVVAPAVIDDVVTNSGDSKLNITLGQSLNNNDFDAFADDINNALRGGNLSVTLEYDIWGSHAGNCDRGYADCQGEEGLYSDYINKATAIFHMNDPRISSGTVVGDIDYRGKFRPPVSDWFDTMKFYKDYGDTQYEYNRVFFPRIYSDGDFIYAVAVIDEDEKDTTGYIGFFIYDYYCRRFVLRSRVNESKQVLIDPTLSKWFGAGIGTGLTTRCIPISPCVCRIKHHNNKLVCAYLGHFPGDVSNIYILLCESKDDGYTWEKLTHFDYSGFTEYLQVAGVDPAVILDFRLRMVSNGSGLLLVWRAWALSGDKTFMNYMHSRDGGATWKFGISNMLQMFLATKSKYDCTNIITPLSNYRVNFDLSVDQAGRFILAGNGYGLVTPPHLDPPSGEEVSAFELGNRCFVVWYTDNSSLLDWQLGGKIYPSWDYKAEIDGYERGRYISDIALCNDSIHDWDYGLLKIKTETRVDVDESEDPIEGSYSWTEGSFTCLVRFKFMPSQFWSTYPDWVNTGTGNRRSSHAFIMEPPNRNTAVFHSVNLVDDYEGDFISYMSLIEHRGHLMAGFVVDPARVASGPGAVSNGGLYNGLVCFKSWHNVPVNYAVRQNYLPMCDDPSFQGWVLAATHANIDYLNDRYENEIVFSTNLANMPLASEYFTAYSENVETYPLGYNENVLRFTVAIGPMGVGGDINILECVSPMWDDVTSTQRYARLQVMFRTDMLRFNVSHLASYDDNIEQNVWYEYMVIRSIKKVAIYRRLYNDFTSSASAEQWVLLYSSDNCATIAAILPRYSYIHFGGIEVDGGNYYAGTWWKFKNIQSSRSYSDISPTSKHYLVDSPVYREEQDKGVLSSKRDFCFAYPDFSFVYRGVCGECISPNPIWFGDNWLARVESKFSKEAILWSHLVYKNNVPNNIVTNIGINNDFITMGDGANPITYPTFNQPNGMNFDGVSQYLSAGSNSYKYTLTSNFTISMWVRRNAAVSCMLISKLPAGVNTGYGLYWNNVMDQIFFYGLSIAPNYVASDHVFTEVGEWVHICVVVNVLSVRFYKNGTFINEESIPALASNNATLYIGSNSTPGLFLSGDISGVGIFNYSATADTVSKLYLEGPYGPAIPSNTFMNFYGQYHSADNSWRLAAMDYGGSSDNVINNNRASRYYSDRDGVAGVLPGGLGYNYGDVEVILYNTDDGYITADAALFDNIEATDVAIYAQDLDPSVFGWVGPLIVNTQFHYFDTHYDLPLDVYNNVGGLANGIISSGGPWRDGVYVGEKMLICIDSHPDHYDVLAIPSNNIIDTVVYNSANRLQLSDSSISPGAINIIMRHLSSKLMVRFTESTYRYWRFVFTNNATNGSKIKVGTIRLGKYLEFEHNPSMNLNTIIIGTKDSISGVDGTVHNIPIGKIKKQFQLNFENINMLSDDSDYNILKQAYLYSQQNGAPFFLITGMYNEKDTTTLVYPCSVTKNLDVKQDQFPYGTIAISLEEL
jgi:hypothetical protein